MPTRAGRRRAIVMRRDETPDFQPQVRAVAQVRAEEKEARDGHSVMDEHEQSEAAKAQRRARA
jgi:hypothetical protein